ncbi:hypothetical protein KAM461_02990 [Aeromonas hydrophila]|nr:hypothetical protein KAM461_02990 [Aeromonas hydrophila]
MALSGSLAMVMCEVAAGICWRFPNVARISIDEVGKGACNRVCQRALPARLILPAGVAAI